VLTRPSSKMVKTSASHNCVEVQFDLPGLKAFN
jgi:hypothetical protein